MARHFNIVKKHRKNTECGVVEDELHFLDNCVKFTNLCSKLIKDAGESASNPVCMPSDASFKPSDLFFLYY